ncbi:MAG TPA: hypothetical protein VJR92_14365 [Gemmatimonadaceae bacterium]|nr:hypothetical protein [Gemmatimonadaceae bacterium]
MNARHFRSVRRSAFLMCAIAALQGCGGATDPVAQFENVTFKSAVFAINGTPIGVPSAINTATAATVRAEETYDFDVAFDLDNNGDVVLLTQRQVGRPIAGDHAVSLQLAGVSFDAVVQAPRSGWVADSVLTVGVGEVFMVRAQSRACQFAFGSNLHSKMIVDSVNVATRRIWVTTLNNPNCGFRQLIPGRPRF